MTTTMRAAIMLAVLVGLPAAWVYYGPLPPQAQRVVDRFVTAAKEAVDWEKITGEPGETPAALPRTSAPMAIAGASASSFDVRPAAEAASPRATGLTETAPTAAQRAATLAERVEPLGGRLRAWGAAEYRLEPWGSGGRLFRFSCEMPLGEGLTATRQFEAIAADPQASVERVVADVQAWRATQMTAMR